MAGVRTLTLDIAEKLVEDSYEIDLEDFTFITDDAAAGALAKHNGDLSLDDLTRLSDAAAGALAKHEGILDLSGLTRLSDAAAAALAKHKGDLHLNGLTHLSNAAAAALAKHKGFLSLNRLKRPEPVNRNDSRDVTSTHPLRRPQGWHRLITLA